MGLLNLAGGGGQVKQTGCKRLLMILFDKVPREDLDARRFDESHFEYLNRTARLEIRAAAELMERWFSQCPVECKVDIRKRIRNKSEVNFHSAFFELFLMELLRALDCEFETHPEMPNATTHPDFLVHPKSAEPFYLEAASINPSLDDEREDRFISQVLNQLDQIQDSGFHLVPQAFGRLVEQPSGRKIRKQVEEWLRTLDPKEVDEAVKAHGDAAIPEFEHTSGEWKLTVRARPVREKGQRVGFVGAPKLIADHRRIRSAIEKKGPKYGILDKAYVVALNLGPILFSNDYDIHTALFGPEQVRLGLLEDGTIQSQGTNRSGEGALFDRNAPKHTRISALLVAQNLRPDTVRQAQIKLFHNPWAAILYNSSLTRLSQAVADGGAYRDVEGIEIGELFQFPDGYP